MGLPASVALRIQSRLRPERRAAGSSESLRIDVVTLSPPRFVRRVQTGRTSTATLLSVRDVPLRPWREEPAGRRSGAVLLDGLRDKHPDEYEYHQSLAGWLPVQIWSSNFFSACRAGSGMDRVASVLGGCWPAFSAFCSSLTLESLAR